MPDRTHLRHIWQGARSGGRCLRALIGLSAGAVAIASDKGSFGVLLAAYWTTLGASLGALAGHFTPVETLVYAAPVR